MGKIPVEIDTLKNLVTAGQYIILSLLLSTSARDPVCMRPGTHRLQQN